jgi:sugar (pentulose or hexulose) kinase
MRYALAIDLGNGELEVAVVEKAGRIVASATEKATTHPLPRCSATSRLWAQSHADVLGIPVHRVADPSYSKPIRSGPPPQERGT